jgi:hypothetical protein
MDGAVPVRLIRRADGALVWATPYREPEILMAVTRDDLEALGKAIPPFALSNDDHELEVGQTLTAAMEAFQGGRT